MRTLTAISLLALFLFNLTGYRFVFNFLKDRSDKQFECLIDKEQYDQTQLFTISVDMNMPYQADQTDFERVSGEVSLDGKVYKFVKRRISNGQMHLVCIPDATKSRLQDAEENKNARESNAENTLAKNLVADYDFEMFKDPQSIKTSPVSRDIAANEAILTFLWVKSTIQPPDTKFT